MSVKVKKTGQVTLPPVLAEFQPMRSLWEGSPALYPSQSSARWELRKLRAELAQAQAVALHRGRILVHPQRFVEVVERAALAGFADRIGRDQES